MSDSGSKQQAQAQAPAPAQAQAQRVGGQRNAQVSRRKVAANGESNSSQAEGILKFYAEDNPGFTLSPSAVLTLTFGFMGIVLFMHIVTKVSHLFFG